MKNQNKWEGIDTTRMRHYWFETIEMEAKYPGLLDKLKQEYTKLSDFYEQSK